MTYQGAIDQGTTSTKFTLYDSNLKQVDTESIVHEQINQHPGWCEHDPDQIISNVVQCIHQTMSRHPDKNLIGIGITNQRETIVAVNKSTKKAVYNAIVWHDQRTESIVTKLKKEKQNDDAFKYQEECGLPINTQFSAVKMKWLLEHVDEVKLEYEADNLMFCTIDSWILVNLTGKFLTDVTNASRTMLMDIRTLKQSQTMMDVFEIKESSLCEIKPCCQDFGTLQVERLKLDEKLKNTKVTSILGDQQSATLGQLCTSKGDAKCTYGTGAFLLANTGNDIIQSKNGLLTTPCFKLGEDEAAVQGLEGSIGVCASLIEWLIKNMNFAKDVKDLNEKAESVSSTEGLIFVPAFSGLFAPQWRMDSRGMLLGLTQFHKDTHICRSALDAITLQVNDVLDCFSKDMGIPVHTLKVDGGVVNSRLCMQIQSNVSDIPVYIPHNIETTSLGAAIGAKKFIEGVDIEKIKEIVSQEVLKPDQSKLHEQLKIKIMWADAVKRTYNWDKQQRTD